MGGGRTWSRMMTMSSDGSQRQAAVWGVDSLGKGIGPVAAAMNRLNGQEMIQSTMLRWEGAGRWGG